jgi:aminoglycoside phosphotransferase (APT) family kinase protein
MIDTEPHLAGLLAARRTRRPLPPYQPMTSADILGLLERWFADRVPGSRVLDVFRLGGGASKEQFRFTLDEGGTRTAMVLRMDPLEGITETCRRREHELLRAMQGVVPAPSPLFLDAEAAHFPQPAIIMELVPGTPKPSGIGLSVTGLGTVLGDPLRGLIRPQYLDLLARIHRFDWRRAELPSFGCPTADAKQPTRWLVAFWKELLEQDVVAREPVIRLATQWLEAHVPDCPEPVLVHGDFRTGNYLFDEGTGRITAVLDWEMAYIGDFHADLCWLLQPVFGTRIDGVFRVSDIFEGEADFLAAYETASGNRVDPVALHYFRIFNNWKSYILVSVLGMRAARSRHNHQDVLLTFLAATGPMFVAELARLLGEGEMQ